MLVPGVGCLKFHVALDTTCLSYDYILELGYIINAGLVKTKCYCILKSAGAEGGMRPIEP